MDSFGIESAGKHDHAPLRAPARFLVLLDSGGSALARLYTEKRELAGEFDAGSEEVAVMTRALQPATGARGSEWDAALGSLSDAERASAKVYTLDV